MFKSPIWYWKLLKCTDQGCCLRPWRKRSKRVASGSQLCCLYKTMFVFEDHHSLGDVTSKLGLCICVTIHFVWSLVKSTKDGRVISWSVFDFLAWIYFAEVLGGMRSLYSVTVFTENNLFWRLELFGLTRCLKFNDATLRKLWHFWKKNTKYRLWIFFSQSLTSHTAAFCKEQTKRTQSGASEFDWEHSIKRKSLLRSQG